MTTYDEFQEAYPDGVVLQPADTKSEAASDTDEPATVNYDAEPYRDYVEANGFGLGAHRGTGPGREWDRTDIDPKTVVLGIEEDDDALGFPLPGIEVAGGIVEATVGERDVVVVATRDGLHAFETPQFELRVTDDGHLVGDGVGWNTASGRSDDGRVLERIPSRRLFAFAWQDDHGPDAFYG